MKKLKHFLVVILVTLSETYSFADHAGLIQFKKTGKIEIVRDYSQTQSEASFKTCGNVIGKASLSDIEFIEQPDACAKMSLIDYDNFLDRVFVAVSKGSSVEKISFNIPPNLDFQEAKERTLKKFTKSEIKRGAQLKVVITGTLPTTAAAGFHFMGTQKKKKWIDDSSMIIFQAPDEK